MVKQTHKHVIIINYDYRRRIVPGPEAASKKVADRDPEILRRLQPEAFSSWLRKNNLLPPDFDLPEFDEANIMKEYEEANSNPLEKIADHEEDRTTFEICLINKANSGLIISATVHQGEVRFGKTTIVQEDALEFAKMSSLQRARSLGAPMAGLEI